MKTGRSVAGSGHEKHSMLKIGDRTGSWISPDVIHPTVLLVVCIHGRDSDRTNLHLHVMGGWTMK